MAALSTIHDVTGNTCKLNLLMKHLWLVQRAAGQKIARRALTTIWDYSLAIASKQTLAAASKGTSRNYPTVYDAITR
jgi:hypothetical protein